MTNPASVTIIILNWNNWQDTRLTIEACQKLAWPALHIIVVDNHSDNDSADKLHQFFPELDLIVTTANLGFAGGNNVGIRKALARGTDFIWLLNSDAIPAPDALTPLVSALQAHHSAACASSKIYFDDDPKRIWFAGGSWSKGRLRLRQQGAYQSDHGQFAEMRHIGSVTGCSMLVPSAMFKTVGLLDERYFLYWEDTDWSARALKNGYFLLFVPASHVWHKVSATISPRSELQHYYVTRNGLFFSYCHDIFIMPLVLLYLGGTAFVGLLQGNTALLTGFLKGCADFLHGRHGRRNMQ
jgi:GT2 family glycosyltransferase